MHSSADVLRVLGAEGYRVNRIRLEMMLARGDVDQPLLVGGRRVWTEAQIDQVRRELQRRDGFPRRGEGNGEPRG